MFPAQYITPSEMRFIDNGINKLVRIAEKVGETQEKKRIPGKALEKSHQENDSCRYQAIAWILSD